jgi:hypothetical protein
MTRRKKREDEADEMQWRQMIAGYYRLALNNPPEEGYMAHGMFLGWEGDDGMITSNTISDWTRQAEQKLEELCTA